jgi:hypothetical protein
VIADTALDLERSGRRRDLGGQHQRLAAVEVGQHARGDIGLPRIGGGEAGDDRVLQLVEQRAHSLLDLVDRADMREGAAADLGCSRHQEGIGRRADADHVDARASPHGRDGVEQLLLVADLAIGQEHDLAQKILIAAAAVGERSRHRRHHLGTAARLQGRHEGFRVVDMRGIGRHRVGKQHLHGVIETNDVEPVGRL